MSAKAFSSRDALVLVAATGGLVALIAVKSARADEAAKAFGYSSYSIRDVNVGGGRNVQPYPRMMAMAAAPMDSAKMSAPIAVEGGKATVSVTVNGSVQMK